MSRKGGNGRMEVKIIEFIFLFKRKAERELTQLVNQGWRIVAAGGGGSFPSYVVVLQRGDRARPDVMDVKKTVL